MLDPDPEDVPETINFQNRHKTTTDITHGTYIPTLNILYNFIFLKII